MHIIDTPDPKNKYNIDSSIMKFIGSVLSLPKISLKTLEQQLLSTHHAFSKHPPQHRETYNQPPKQYSSSSHLQEHSIQNYKSATKLQHILDHNSLSQQKILQYHESTIAHNDEIKITSPFYQRKYYHEKCSCPYHRARRTFAIARNKRQNQPQGLASISYQEQESLLQELRSKYHRKDSKHYEYHRQANADKYFMEDSQRYNFQEKLNQQQRSRDTQQRSKYQPRKDIPIPDFQGVGKTSKFNISNGGSGKLPDVLNRTYIQQQFDKNKSNEKSQGKQKIKINASERSQMMEGRKKAKNERLNSNHTLYNAQIAGFLNKKSSSKGENTVMDIDSQYFGARVDHVNHKFLQHLSKRMEHQKYKEKYLKMLMQFINLKQHQDKHYLEDTKHYLSSLPLALNYFKLEDLISLSIQHLRDSLMKVNDDQYLKQILEKLSYYMNCQGIKIPNILEDIQKAWKDMQNYLNNLKTPKFDQQLLQKQELERNKRKRQEEMEAEINRMYQEKQRLRLQQKVSIRKSGRNSLNKMKMLTETDENIKITQKLIQKNDNVDCEQISKQKSQEINEQILEVKPAAQLKSVRISKINEDKQNKLSELINVKNTTQKQKHKVRKSRASNIKKSKQKDSIKIEALNLKQSQDRSAKSSFIASNNSDLQSFRQEKLKGKNRLGKLKKNIINYNLDPEIDEKYKDIHYQDYCTKQTFYHIISEVTRLDRTEQERAHFIFQKLQIQSIISAEIGSNKKSNRKMQQILDTFKPFFNAVSQDHFMKRFIYIRDRYYVEKLSRQLDEMLCEIRKNDRRQFWLDIMPEREDKRPVMNFQTTLRQYKPFQINKPPKYIFLPQHLPSIQKSQPQNSQTEQQSKQLNQIELSEFKLKSIYPDLTKIQKVVENQKVKTKEQNFSESYKMSNREKQKDILHFMKKKHNKMFQILNYEINQLSSSINFKKPI